MTLKDTAVKVTATACAALVLTPVAGTARTITLDEAMSIAANNSSRASVIRGDLDVAEANYFARRINFYVPEVSINGSLPTYAEDESYRFFAGATQKSLYKTNDLGFESFIQLKQSLFTGGGVTVRANLLASREEYPNVLSKDLFFNERSRQGYFSFSLDQPLLKPSEAKFELNNRRDDFEIAKLIRVEEESKLRAEVVENYVGALQASLKAEIAEAKVESARLKAEVDSSKLTEGVVSEDTWLATASSRIDAELGRFDAQTALAEKNRLLAVLLDLDLSEKTELVEPPVPTHPSEQELASLVNQWEESISIKKAELEYMKSDRAADFAAGGHGLNGSLSANYSFGRGKVEIESFENDIDDNINTNSWNVALNFTLPVWDGGASGAAVKASRLTAEKTRLEFQKAQRAARSELQALVNKYNVSYRKLGVLRQQVELARKKLSIAEERMNNGEISRITYLESRVFLFEAQDKYLEELKNYYLSKAELDGTFAS